MKVMKISKRFFTLMLLIIFLTTIFPGGLTMYANNSPSLSMEKNEFIVGEKIVLNYTGTTGKDWIGIYAKNGTPGPGNPSIMWEYTSKTGQPDGTMEFEGSLKAGSYDAVLLQNDGYTELFRINFNVIEDNEVPAKPSGVVYEATGKKGKAEGTITIKPAQDESKVQNYVIYWGNDEGKLSEYTPIAVIRKTGNEIKFNIDSNVIIPEDAKCILVYSSNSKGESEDFVKVDIPDSKLPEKSGNPIYKFQVITDTHIRNDASHVHNKNFDRALKQIKELAPDSLGIMHAGDITDTGFSGEYTQFKKIWDANKEGLPNIYLTIGNHDLYTGKYLDAMEKFSSISNTDRAYNDYWIGGNHFIFLGSEKGGHEYLNAELSEEQLSWLEEKLAEDAAKNKPIFVFIHQPLINTVAGSYANQGWYGVNQDKKLRDILSKYPQVVLFSGHTHWEFDSKNNMFDGKGETFTAFNASAVAYLWTDLDQYKAGSQGYFVEVYNDKVLVKGRDFENSKWVSNAQFKVDLVSDDNENTKGNDNENGKNEDEKKDKNVKTRDIGIYSSIAILFVSIAAFIVFFINSKRKKV